MTLKIYFKDLNMKIFKDFKYTTGRVNINSIDHVRVNEANIDSFKVILDTIFPIRYEKSFFSQILNNSDIYAYIMYIGSKEVGVYAFFIKGYFSEIIILGFLAEFRMKGLGTFCLNLIEKFVLQEEFRVKEIILHVQLSNFGAKMFYEKNGYSTKSIVENYYRDVNSNDAYLMSKEL